MKIKEAIKELENILAACTILQYHDTPDALKLGIEALKLIRELRLHHNVLPDYFLPGETKD